MTDRTSADRTSTDRPSGETDTTVRIEPGPGTGKPPAAPRDDLTVDMTKRETEKVRLPRELPAPRPSDQPMGPPPTRALPPTLHTPLPPAFDGWAQHPGPVQQQPWTPGYPPAPPPQRPVSPPLPPSGGRANIALIVFGVLAALVITGGAWALILLAGGSSPFGSGETEEPQAGAPSASSAPASPAPVPPYPPPSAGSPVDPSPGSGPTGQVQVSWTVSGAPYQATVTTSGSTGSATVTYPPYPGGELRTIRQTLTLIDSGGRLAYVGSDPRDASTGGPAATYRPDIFVLSSTAEGKVYINEVCDTSGSCWPATME